MEETDLDLETLFNEAADIVQNKGATAGLQDKVLLNLYGLYKMSTVGPCKESQPSKKFALLLQY
jgi:acyl-CoA-binding protein